MKTKLVVAFIVFITVLLNWVPAIGKLFMLKTNNRIPFDSILHAVYYFLIGTLLVNTPSIKKKSLLLSLLALFIFSLSIEIIQGFIPGRSFSITDIVSNFLGISVAYVLQRIVRRPKAQVT